jgi:hypothetical protein
MRQAFTGWSSECLKAAVGACVGRWRGCWPSLEGACEELNVDRKRHRAPPPPRSTCVYLKGRGL